MLAVGRYRMKMIMTLLVLLCFSHLPVLLANAANNSSSTLELNLGLRLSPSTGIYDATVGAELATTVGVPGFNGSWLLPILSSTYFNSSDSSQSLGFSFGFLFMPGTGGTYFDIYLAVCGGISGNPSTTATSQAILYEMQDQYGLQFSHTMDGYVVPVWSANPTTPLASYNASLLVVEANTPSTTKQLQLRDINGRVLWNVSNVGLMELQDTGSLIIYDSSNRKNVIWQSPRDTLFVGEKLTVGKQLTSPDDSYSAVMEKGGLVLYANTLPYWAIPALLTLQDNPFNVSNKVMSSPCSPNDTAYAILGAGMELILNPGSCTDTSLVQIYRSAAGKYTAVGPFSFVKLGNDGWFRIYAVNGSDFVQIPFWDAVDITVQGAEPIVQVALWDSCFVPWACGPFSVCTPYADSLCSCPGPPPSTQALPSFQPIDVNALSKGCTRATDLPKCTKDEHVNTTHFLQLNHTASVFLFSGFELFNSSSVKDVETCKTSCSANCSCNGFFYQANHSACFFITDEISLLNLTSDIISDIPSNTTVSPAYVYNVHIWPMDLLRRDYVTYLKVKDETSPPTGLNRSTEGLARSTVIAIAVASSFAALVGLGLAMFLLHARETKLGLLRKQAREAALKEEELREVLPLLPSRFSYQELHEATNGFSKLLGVGGCGSVYAGMLQDGQRVAVKTLDIVMKGQLSQQFLAEVATIGQTSHHNIVRLVGFCWEVSNQMLVYEYMERGSLDHWLFHKPGNNACDDEGAGRPLLDWKTRYNVLLGVSRGLNYLHEECPKPILHFDIKPQNILLDGAFVAKLADFGMSRFMQRDVSQLVTGVRGTPGYIAPEWFTHGAVSKKSDIYSMGMVMLEVVGGRKILDLELLNNVNNATDFHNDSASRSMKHEEWHFPSWAARKCEEGLEMELVDKRLQGAFNEEQARRLIYTAFWCIQEDAGMRPYVPAVLKWLEGSSPVKQPPFLCAAHSSSNSSIKLTSSSSLL